MPLRAVKPLHETHTRILDAAEELFMQHGFEGTSMRALTSKAGVIRVARHRVAADLVGEVRGARVEMREDHLGEPQLNVVSHCGASCRTLSDDPCVIASLIPPPPAQPVNRRGSTGR